MNTSIHTSLNCSPFEMVHGQRAAFPLCPANNLPSIDTLPPENHTYIHRLNEKFNLIRTQARENIEESQIRMRDSSNKNIRPLNLKEGDFVYLKGHFSGKGAKLHRKYDGPFIVQSVLSQHRVTLLDPAGEKHFKHPVHINNLKLAHLRNNANNNDRHSLLVSPQTPQTPQTPLPHKTPTQDPVTGSDATRSEETPHDLRRSNRLKNKQTDFALFNLDSSADEIKKIKRVLGFRSEGRQVYYLVNFRGQPSVNSEWVPYSQLDRKAKQYITMYPPPEIRS